jgi:hypothetical protein
MPKKAGERLGVDVQTSNDIQVETQTEYRGTEAQAAANAATADEQEPKKKSQADAVVEVLLEEATEVFTTPDGIPFVRLPVDKHHEIIPLNGADMKSWLGWRVYQNSGQVPGNSVLGAALNVVRGKAIAEVRELHNRVAPADGGDGLWYDLSNENWQAVRVDSSGWRLVSDPPILFRRYQHQQPQVKPQSGGDFSRILQFVNVSEDKQLLFMVYVLSCFLPGIAHPVALFTGPKGSAKTTAAAIIRRLVDPSQIETFSYPSQKQEVIQKLSHNWMAIFDNISSVPTWFSDVLCRASTGAGDSKRQLYSDDDDVIYSYRRCVGLTSITSAADMPDLLDRSVTFELQRISPQQRLSEQDLFARLDAAMPQILGGGLDVLAEAIRIKPHVELHELPRMADFAEWGAAIAVALGYTQEQFMEAYEADIKDRNRDVVESHPVGAAVKAFMQDQDQWEGTASELHAELERVAATNRIDVENKQWPNAANWVKRRLDEVSTDLQEIGITITHDRAAGSGDRIICLSSHADSQHEDCLELDHALAQLMDDDLIDDDLLNEVGIQLDLSAN